MNALPRSRGQKWMRLGLILLVVGTGPLALIILASKIGIGDPNPNPIGPGLLAFLTFWPSIIIMVIGLGMTHRERGRSAGRLPRDG